MGTRRRERRLVKTDRKYLENRLAESTGEEAGSSWR